MDKTGKFVSKIDQGYLKPHTRLGIPLSDHSLVRLTLYECGLNVVRDWNYERVCSPFWRLYCNLDSGASIFYGKRRIFLDAGTLVLVPAQTLFDCRQEKPVRHLWIHFSLEPGFLFTHLDPFRFKADLVSKSLVRQLGKAIRLKAGFWRDRRLHHAVNALIHYCLLYEETPYRKEVSHTLTKVLEYIHGYLRSKLDNHTLARIAGMSVEGFIRWFKRTMKKTPHRFVLDQRLEESCRQLSFSNRTIDEIAAEFEFANRYHFSRVFSAVLGCGPSTYRKRQKELIDKLTR